jgi:hypothetical protein
MSTAFISAVEEHVPDVAIVFDRYHAHAPQSWALERLLPPHLLRYRRGNQRQNQNPETPSLGIPRHDLFQAQTPSLAPSKLLINRMNHKQIKVILKKGLTKIEAANNPENYLRWDASNRCCFDGDWRVVG